jgi:hypothetical protein
MNTKMSTGADPSSRAFPAAGLTVFLSAERNVVLAPRSGYCRPVAARPSLALTRGDVMTIRPEYDGTDFGEEMWEPPAPPPAVLEEEQRELYEGERELYEQQAEQRELDYLDPGGNELHVRGQVCKRCGRDIAATQDARMLPDGHWVHEVCPAHH